MYGLYIDLYSRSRHNSMPVGEDLEEESLEGPSPLGSDWAVLCPHVPAHIKQVFAHYRSSPQSTLPSPCSRSEIISFKIIE